MSRRAKNPSPSAVRPKFSRGYHAREDFWHKIKLRAVKKSVEFPQEMAFEIPIPKNT